MLCIFILTEQKCIYPTIQYNRINQYINSYIDPLSLECSTAAPLSLLLLSREESENENEFLCSLGGSVGGRMISGSAAVQRRVGELLEVELESAGRLSWKLGGKCLLVELTHAHIIRWARLLGRHGEKLLVQQIVRHRRNGK
jgi:hypothetical protein